MSEDIKVKCDKCGSTQITANKKGFSAGKAVAGAVLTGGIGLAAGAIGSNKVIVTCLKCGHNWKPAEQAKQKKLQNNRDFVQKYKENKKKFITLYESGNKDEAFEHLQYSFPNWRYKTSDEAYSALKKVEKEDKKFKSMSILVIFIILLLIIIWMVF